MNNLIPEARVDINGRVTTRWVRPAPKRSGSGLTPPPPSLPSTSSSPVTSEDVPLLSWTMEQVRGVMMRMEVMDPVVAYRLEEMLTEARTVSLETFGKAKGVIMEILFAIRDSTSGHELAEGKLLIRNVAALGITTYNRHPDQLVAGLRTYADFAQTRDFLTELHPDELKRAQALYKVAAAIPQEHLDANGGSSAQGTLQVRLGNDDLAAFVLDNPDLADDVIALISERGSDDVSMIKSVLGNEEKALKDGVL